MLIRFLVLTATFASTTPITVFAAAPVCKRIEFERQGALMHDGGRIVPSRTRRWLYLDMLPLGCASAPEINRIPGVNSNVASNIASAGEQQRLHTWSDVDALDGVGPSTLEKIRRWSTLDREGCSERVGTTARPRATEGVSP